MVWILLGPPGSGKGTQARICAPKMGMTHISTGELLRSQIKAGTALGLEAAKYTTAGNLLPDATMLKILVSKMKPLGYSNIMLDGYPRTKGQALALDKLLDESGSKVKQVINIEVSENELIERMTQRLTCSNCGIIYNLRDVASVASGDCPKCSGHLYKRDDDNTAAISKRLQAYNEQTVPLVNYYAEKGLLERVEGHQPPQIVSNAILDIYGVLV